jgi:hypothetical protein
MTIRKVPNINPAKHAGIRKRDIGLRCLRNGKNERKRSAVMRPKSNTMATPM